MHCRLLVTYEGAPTIYQCLLQYSAWNVKHINFIYWTAGWRNKSKENHHSSIPAFFLRLSFLYCISCVFNCGDLLCIIFMALCLFVGIWLVIAYLSSIWEKRRNLAHHNFEPEKEGRITSFRKHDRQVVAEQETSFESTSLMTGGTYCFFLENQKFRGQLLKAWLVLTVG